MTAPPGLAPVIWQIRDRVLTTEDHTLVMGILNTTPDSFSDGGLHSGSADAVAAGMAMWEAGVDIVDVGGESTRPGATPVDPDDELARVMPVVHDLAVAGVTVSIDTRNAAVASAAIEAGAAIVNDVSGLSDPAMIDTCAAAGVGVVVMHMQGSPQTMQDDPRYDDVVGDVAEFLLRRVDRAQQGGIDRTRVCIDPGIGFGKTFAHNLELMAGIGGFVETGLPVLVGASRKGFLGRITEASGHPTSPDQRDPATAATTALAIAQGAAVIRAHDVGSTIQSARTADAIVRAASSRWLWGDTWPG